MEPSLSNAEGSFLARVEASFLARVKREAKWYTVWHTAQGATRMNEKCKRGKKDGEAKKDFVMFS